MFTGLYRWGICAQQANRLAGPGWAVPAPAESRKWLRRKALRRAAGAAATPLARGLLRGKGPERRAPRWRWQGRCRGRLRERATATGGRRLGTGA